MNALVRKRTTHLFTLVLEGLLIAFAIAVSMGFV